MLLDRADFADLPALAAHRQRLWERQRDYVAAKSALHRRAWNGAAPPQRLEALAELPLIDKEMLRESQRLHPPFGDYLAAEPATIARVHRTSGTTGTAMNLALSAQDALETAIVGGRAQAASGLGPGHRVVHCLNYRLWMGGFTDHTTLEATGAAVVPFGVGDTRLLIRTIRELGITAISCTPSYPAVLERVLAEKFPDVKPRNLGLKLGLFGGEAGLDNLDFRRRLEDTWGFQVRNANYGVSDVMCLFAGQCELSNDLHFMGGDALFAELADGDAPVAWTDGATGELVLTHLSKECQPLVRFRSGDVITLTGTGRCACGRWTPRLRVVGRADDMVVVRGLNVFPTAVAAVVNGFKELSGEYRIVLPHGGPYDRLPIEAELADGQNPSAPLTEAIERAFKSIIGATAEVTLLAPHSLPRTEGKTRRVFRPKA